MLSSFSAFFNRGSSSSYDVLEKREPKVTKFIYRDDLRKNKLKPSSKKPKNFASVKPVKVSGEKEAENNLERRSFHGSVEGKGVVRVKVIMTKQEAARLLSKCKDGGVLGFKDVAHELIQIPMNRVNLVSPSTSSPTVLKSIPEEF